MYVQEKDICGCKQWVLLTFYLTYFTSANTQWDVLIEKKDGQGGAIIIYIKTSWYRDNNGVRWGLHSVIMKW